jgi:hypothetical protein
MLACCSVGVFSACSLWRRALWCGLSSQGFTAGNACGWSTRAAASMGCGWHQPTSHCACPLNVCLFSGNHGGLTKCVHAQPSPLLPGRGWAGAPEAIYGLCGSTGACLCIQLVAIPVGVTVCTAMQLCAAVHEGGRVTLLFLAYLHASAVSIYKQLAAGEMLVSPR